MLSEVEKGTRPDKATQTERLTQELEAEILNGDLSPGQRLDEMTLAERFAVSRTPVREALRILATSGLVELQPRIGAVVARPTVSEVMEIFELVGELEAVASRLACERMTDAHSLRIAEAYKECCEAVCSKDVSLYMDCNDIFHRAIHDAADNRALSGQLSQLSKRLTPYRRFITFRPERREKAEKEHEMLACALRERNGEAAALAMKDHVRMLADDALILARSLKL
ncbi:GntR family transcriptional regulator [Roseovarius arcticus]|uniref:GntR family transcriptional regulator n=1 Tax=Roseovarius arcticus TaxID=2547404 RepID=UPI0011108516|nr:GntR family transcriptional regulator [Roseovarius arcticus]